jgi:hypothetical protein
MTTSYYDYFFGSAQTEPTEEKKTKLLFDSDDLLCAKQNLKEFKEEDIGVGDIEEVTDDSWEAAWNSAICDHSANFDHLSRLNFDLDFNIFTNCLENNCTKINKLRDDFQKIQWENYHYELKLIAGTATVMQLFSIMCSQCLNY